jgi:ribonuclease VapC
MVVDTSAIVAVLFNEPERISFLKKLAHAQSRQISAVSYMEAGMVMSSHFGNNAEAVLEEMLREAGIVVAQVNLTQARLALAAFRQYGKGRHPAGLNFGDCFSYALAKNAAEPLLFKGSDFVKTDILVA